MLLRNKNRLPLEDNLFNFSSTNLQCIEHLGPYETILSKGEDSSSNILLFLSRRRDHKIAWQTPFQLSLPLLHRFSLPQLKIKSYIEENFELQSANDYKNWFWSLSTKRTCKKNTRQVFIFSFTKGTTNHQTKTSGFQLSKLFPCNYRDKKVYFGWDLCQPESFPIQVDDP